MSEELEVVLHTDDVGVMKCKRLHALYPFVFLHPLQRRIIVVLFSAEGQPSKSPALRVNK